MSLTNKVSLGKINGKEIAEYTIKNKHGIEVSIMEYGATITKLVCPDKEGKIGDIVLGFSSLEGYLHKDNPYMNCIIGRFANRISNSKFSVENTEFFINSTVENYALHGGINGFDKKIWEVVHHNTDTIILSYTSVDGEEGFPGTLVVEVKYMISEYDELHIEYTATIDKACPINLTSHCYFNLSAGKESNVLSHDLRVIGDTITELNDSSIPTGVFSIVDQTIFDLNDKKNLGHQFESIDGYDHNWVLGEKSDRPKFVATLYHALSGRLLEVYTTEPGLQIYTSNGFDGSLTNTKNDVTYDKFAGICLETQLFPDSPNHPHFPNAVLYPDDVYKHHTIYKMKVVDQ
jgi:aldose 1-epimerase